MTCKEELEDILEAIQLLTYEELEDKVQKMWENYEPDLNEAKEIIIKHLNESLTVKTTKWVFDHDVGGYKEVDAGYSKEELKMIQYYHDRDMSDTSKLRDLLEDLI